ncbi:DUF1366 domain-containing protein [Streptococcus gallolyticus]|uniref:DUF1366 domain-containing protein n=1 Tax=Streptococcus gallolyticus TaxID=315405 RepID=UPI00228479EE|nr:DUF1366 domain-containing protein [Streptococcus gallolyticus]MCY7173682.1 DUF1366 domain-containing protein [Streptococcus gallolyticus subsp. gallolyticus]MCY7175803.1 DUF1366 domain-containing protein [Streptococcus gallolyticus subsp. gallolyticus]MCY7180257.1 DUF1366 domain-containing protein [Streptococcus gallolyticus subsp. gallolyticus]MCY7184834.1 DUF1366 domain-containing protein [Streptococcus gallolyticus subsp. gallolyticus]MCY7190056.1 DUF1366 domain-containing protein [Strep
MKLKFGSKSQEFAVDGMVTGTKVTLTNDEGALYPVMLPADKISLSNDELENLAKDVIYQENFRDKYENEKFNEITKELASYKENSEVAQATLLDVVTQLYDKGVLTDETTTQN